VGVLTTLIRHSSEPTSDQDRLGAPASTYPAMPSICAKCGGSQRGDCSRPHPYCTRCCRVATFSDGVDCPGHKIRRATAPLQPSAEGDPRRQEAGDDPAVPVDSDADTESQEESEPKHNSSSTSASVNSEEKAPPHALDAQPVSAQPRQVVSASLDDDIPAHLRLPPPSTHTMLKALAKVKPWQKGVIQDGLEISCRAFVVQFERALDSVNAERPDYLRLIPLWLTGEAALWYDNLKESNSSCLQTWQELKTALLQTYGDRLNPGDAWRHLQACSITKGESLEAHADRFRRRMVDLRNLIPAWVCFEEYIRKMRPSTQVYLLQRFGVEISKAEGMKGVTLDIICREAISFESRFAAAFAGSSNPIAPATLEWVNPPTQSTPSSSSSAPAQSPANDRGLSQASNNPSQASNNRQWNNKKRPRDVQRSHDDNKGEKEEKKGDEKPKDRSQVTCWNCGQRGHYRNQCALSPTQVKQENKSRDTSKDKNGP